MPRVPTCRAATGWINTGYSELVSEELQAPIMLCHSFILHINLDLVTSGRALPDVTLNLSIGLTCDVTRDIADGHSGTSA